MWYVLYTGLARIVPYYDALDEGILVLMLVASVMQLFRRGRLPRLVAVGLLLLNAIIVISSLVHTVRLLDTLEYFIRANRAFIVLLYAYLFSVDVDRLLRWFVITSRTLLLANLPSMLYYLVTLNIALLEPVNHDAVRGFFPFANNDSVVVLLVLTLLYEAHVLFFRRQNRNLLLFGGTYLLLVATMNWKVTLLVTGSLVLIAVLRSPHRIRNSAVLALVLLVPALVVFPVIFSRLSRINTSPVYIAAETILRGHVQEYSWLLGTGPGTFTSPMAFANEQPLTEKYGLMALRRYWTEVYTGPTGTLTTSTSSALLLLGETGIPVTLIVTFLLGWLTWRCYRYLAYSPACLTGFVLGIYILPVGIFLDSWTWGYEVMLLMLGAKAASDWHSYRLSQTRLMASSRG